MSDSVGSVNDYSDFVIVAENEWCSRKEERRPVSTDDTYWEIHQKLNKDRDSATIERTRTQLVADYKNDKMLLGDENDKVVIRILEEKQKFQKEIDNRSAADVTFMVNDEECKAERILMAIASPYFKEMLYGQFAEAERLVLKGIESAKIFNDFISAVSPPVIKPNPSNVVALLKLAHRYNVPFLMRNCEAHLMSCYEISTSDRILLAGKYGLDSLLSMMKFQTSWRK